MPAHADVVQRLREAIVTIIGGLAAIQAITGRATSNCIPWDEIEEADLPVVLYQIVTLSQQGESGDGRDGVVQFTAVADGNNADTKVHELLRAIEQGFTSSALEAQGVDGAPMLFHRRDADSSIDGEDAPRDHTRNTHAAHLEVDITITHV